MPIKEYNPEELQKASQPESTPDSSNAEPEGLLHSLGSGLGLTDSSAPSLKHALIEGAAGPVGDIVSSAYQGGKRIAHELGEVRAAGQQGNPAGQVYHAAKAIPFIGSHLDKAMDQEAEGNQAGELGTNLASVIEAAPMLEGIGRGAGVEFVPSRARAGKVFESLKSDLANTPVQMRASANPMQRVAEIDAAQGGMPTTAAKLMTRSQSFVPINYPEMRLFQEGLSSPSRTDIEGMAGSMKSSVKQLNKGLFEDIRDAAETRGRGADYEKAMRETRRAAQLGRAAKYAAGAGAAAVVGNKVTQLAKEFGK